MLPFSHPFTLIVSGPRGCSIMVLIMCLIINADMMIEPTQHKIVYYFAEYQPLFECYEARVSFCHGMTKADAIE